VRKRIVSLVVATLAAMTIGGAAFARPFTDPRSDRLAALDADAKFANEASDPACHGATLVSTGGAFPSNPLTPASTPSTTSAATGERVVGSWRVLRRMG